MKNNKNQEKSPKLSNWLNIHDVKENNGYNFYLSSLFIKL
jgi:hypothetical protein